MDSHNIPEVLPTMQLFWNYPEVQADRAGHWLFIMVCSRVAVDLRLQLCVQHKCDYGSKVDAGW